jgi:hypothetical protein
MSIAQPLMRQGHQLSQVELDKDGTTAARKSIRVRVRKAAHFAATRNDGASAGNEPVAPAIGGRPTIAIRPRAIVVDM